MPFQSIKTDGLTLHLFKPGAQVKQIIYTYIFIYRYCNATVSSSAGWRSKKRFLLSNHLNI